MVITYTIKIEGLEKLKKLEKAIENVIPAMQPIVENFFKSTVYITQGSEIGKSWKERKQPTGSWPLLRKTGRMQSNTKSKVTDNKKTVQIFNDTEYAKYHQTGTKKMVARPLFGKSPKLNETITQFALRHLEISLF